MTGQEFHVSWSGRHAVVTMPEEIDLGNADDVGEQLTVVAGQSPDLVTADLTGTVFCDSAGVYVLTRAHELVAEHGGELRLALGDSPVARIFQLTGLDKIMPVYRDVQQSRATPRAQPGPEPAG
ncbi:MAG TPA: STAS domain-containing protein [Streptosporangiaceae bacterium]|jgi:anti-anti-sigma factor